MKATYQLVIFLAVFCFAFAAQAQQAAAGSILQQGTYVRIDKSAQKFYLYVDGKLKIESVCGTGQGFTKANTTTNGRHHVRRKERVDYKSQKYGNAPMPYPWEITEDGQFVHGSYSFVTMDGKGMAQSHGCIRLPIEVAKEVYAVIKVGDVVDVVGDELESLESLGITGLFEDVGNGEIRMKIADPQKRTTANVKFAREMWSSKRLFYTPKGEKDKAKILIGYPCMPKSTHMPLLEFERAVGKRVVLDG